jgi:predicted RNA binding protein YcfA (HicA-like mRNA interferase family)
MKVRDLIRKVEDDGWRHVKTRGSHRQYKHPVKRGRVTIPGHSGDDVHAEPLAGRLGASGAEALLRRGATRSTPCYRREILNKAFNGGRGAAAD